MVFIISVDLCFSADSQIASQAQPLKKTLFWICYCSHQHDQSHYTLTSIFFLYNTEIKSNWTYMNAMCGSSYM